MNSCNSFLGRRVFTLLLVIVATVAVFVAAGSLRAEKVYADTGWSLSDSMVTLDYSNLYERITINGWNYGLGFTVTSNDPDIVSVDAVGIENHDFFDIQAKHYGNTTITVTDNDGVSKTVAVSVTKPEWSFAQSEVTIDYGDHYTSIGITGKHKMSVFDNNETAAVSSNPSLVTATCDYYDENCYLILTREGTGDAIITVTDSLGGSKTLTVHCPKLKWSLNATKVELTRSNRQFALKPVGKNAYIAKAESSDESVVEVWDIKQDGTVVTLYRNGYSLKPVTITVTANDGSQKKCTITSPPSPLKLASYSAVFKNTDKRNYKRIAVVDQDYGINVTKVKTNNKKVAEGRALYQEVMVGANGSGKCVLTVTDNLGRSAKINVSVPKGFYKANPMTIKTSTKKVSFAKLKKKNQTVAPITLKKAVGKPSYSVQSVKGKSKKALNLNYGTGKITVKKGTPKGTYTMKVKVTVSGENRYLPGTKTVKVTIKVK